MRWPLGLCLVSACWAVLGVPGCVGSPDDSLAHARDVGLRIGYAVEAPYAFVDERGEVTGESPTTAREVATVLGVGHVSWVQTHFARLVSELEAGRFDVIASGLFITDERARRVAFSHPTFRVAPALLVRADTTLPRSCAALARETRARIAVLDGAIEGPMLGACGLPDDRLVVVSDAALGRTALRAGVADALALYGPSARWSAAHESGLAPLPLELGAVEPDRSYGAFAFRLPDRALREAWDRALDDLLHTAPHRAAVAPFGLGVDEEPDVRTAEEVLAR